MALNFASSEAGVKAVTAQSAAVNSIPADALLTTGQLAKALTDAGLPTSEATLNTKACRGNGPNYRRYGRFRLYTWGDAIAWAIAQMGEPAPSAAAHRIARLARKSGAA